MIADDEVMIKHSYSAWARVESGTNKASKWLGRGPRHEECY